MVESYFKPGDIVEVKFEELTPPWVSFPNPFQTHWVKAKVVRLDRDISLKEVFSSRPRHYRPQYIVRILEGPEKGKLFGRTINETRSI